MASLTLEHISKRYPPARRGVLEPLAVDDVSLAVDDGEIVGLLGSSGCGKTSTLRMIAGLEALSSGSIHIGARRVDGLRAAERNVAMAFEGYALYPPLTVGQNIAFSLLRHKVAKDEVRRRVDRIAELLAIADLLELYPPLLSGGQQQRVSLARALVRDADLYLLDEPMSQLEPQLRAKLRARIKEHLIERRTTSVFVTHDQTEAMALADRIAVMSDGVLQQFGSPADLRERPANLFVAGFIGEPPMNVFAAELHAGDAAPALAVLDAEGHTVFELALPAAARWSGFAPGQALKLGLRPHRLGLGNMRAGSLSGWRTDSLARGACAVVVSSHWLGDQSHVGLTIGGQFLTVVADRSLEVERDSRIGLHVPLEAVHVFDAASGVALFHGPDAKEKAR